MLDCAITGGLVVDGTGRPALRADVGIRDGRIVAIGTLDESAGRVIDADGRVVAPGFVDVHTHYDAQVMWDQGVSPSSLHGVTTVVGGNCGFTIAPVSEDSSDYVMRMLACVEGIPVASLEGVLDFGWRTFADWLALLDGRLAVNAGFLAGHSAIRKMVMGPAWQEHADADQLRRMAGVVDESVRAGALGFSSSWGDLHSDHNGDLVPSRYATAEELVTLASVLAEHPGTVLEFIPPGSRVWSDEVIDLMTAMSVEARSALNWNLLSVGSHPDRESLDARLGASDRAAARGGTIVALAMPQPMRLRLNLLTTISYNGIPAWKDALTLPFEERLRALKDPDTRVRLAEGAEARQRERRSLFAEFDLMTVQSVSSPALKHLEGRNVGEIAEERGVSALDVFLDIAVDDDLRACFATPAGGDDDDAWKLRAEHWQDPRVLVGGSDAGAHLDTLSTFAYFTDFVGPTVRDRGLLTLEDAVHKVTDMPAQLYGLRDRGRLAPGFRADVVVFDPDTVCTGDVVLRQDMPKDEFRLFADAVGVDHVLVNGTEVVDRGALTGSTPGTILRSGRDTTPDRT